MSTAAIRRSEAQLSTNFYAKSCPNALPAIRTSIRAAIAKDPRMSAALIRLHFHDCFVHGCDASNLLNNSQTIKSEKDSPPNVSTRGHQVIDAAKAQLETICPAVVSCADILAVAARDASAFAGGPSWDVKLGRRDSTAAFPDEVMGNLPFFNSDLQILIDLFKRRCPAVGGDSNLVAMDMTPDKFDNNYFTNIVQRKGLLKTDQVLFSGGVTDSIVMEYSQSPSRFSADFAAAMIKMGDLQPLTGSAGQVRKICSAANK
ncbi:unnamed protein product [Linum tenue]|uniref:peroxidase n=1 Tax=Linum tenue TaxID=586396 RepID=A0AAV0QVH0_9ROSI|nr:unnamed protein product [Linum tenue]